MEKKAYEKPAMKAVKIEHTQMLCASLIGVKTNSDDENEVDLGYGTGGGNPNTGWAHIHNGVWDDIEDEEW